MGQFYFGLCLSFVIGGPLSAGLMELNGRGGLSGWQWLFLVEGLLTSFVGIIAFCYLSDRPKDAKWSTDVQRSTLERAIARENEQKHAGPAKSIPALLCDVKILYCSLILSFSQLILYGVTFFLPTQIAALFGREIGLTLGTMSAVPWVWRFGCMRDGSTLV